MSIELTIDGQTVIVPEGATVLDAGALTVFADNPDLLFKALHEKCVLTPHQGEFSRLFGNSPESRLAQAVAAAKKAGCVVVLKGAETIIAAPGHDPVVNNHAAPYLATAGTGDVLAGMIAGLLAQDMDPFAAACAAVWIHGDAALRVGPGLVAPDLIACIPVVLRDIL